MKLDDYLCLDCGKGSEDLFDDEPCSHCGSTNLQRSKNRSQLAISVGAIEPMEVMDHESGEKVIVTTMADAQRYANVYSRSQGLPDGTHGVYIRTDSEYKRWRDDQKDKIHAAQRAQKMELSRF